VTQRLCAAVATMPELRDLRVMAEPDVDESEIAKALLFTAVSADILEAKFVGADKY
jgi:hypothetical protein